MTAILRCFMPLPANAAPESHAEILVTVLDASTKDAITGAAVAILGTSPGVVFTLTATDRGQAMLSGVEDGAYRLIVQAHGYQPFRTTVDVVRGKRTLVVIELLPALATIGRVSAHSSVLHEVFDVGSSRKISPTLVDALNRFADVSTTGNMEFGLSTSLRNGDPAATNYSINGVPLASAGAGLSINTDLLAGISVNQDRDTVDFNYLAPTVAPRFSTAVEEGGFGTSLVRSSLQATTGVVGIAAVHSVRGANSALNGQTYLDASGLSYRHVGAAVSVGNYAKLAVPIGNWYASTAIADSRAVSNPIPTYYDGILPAGDGPGSLSTTHSQNVVSTVNGLFGTTALSVGLSSFTLETRDDQSKRFVDLLASPIARTGSVRGSDLTIGAQRSVSPRTDLRATITRTDSVIGGSSTVDKSAVTAGSIEQTTTTITLRSETRANNVLKTYAEASALKSNLASWSPSATAGFTASKPSGTRYGGFLSVGRRHIESSQSRDEQGFLEASGATYDCANGIATIAAPGDSSADASYTRANLSYAREGSDGYINVAVYYDLLRSAMLTNALVPLSAEPAGYLPAGYAESLLAGFQAFGRCSRGRDAINDLYAIEDVSGASSRTVGLSLAGSRVLSRRLIASFGAFLSSARLVGGDARLAAPSSPYQIGRQLPGRPFLKGNVAFDYLAPSHLPELLIDAEYLGVNNARNLPPNLSINIGLEKIVSPTLTVNLVATNVFNQYAGTFVTGRNAVFLATRSGTFPTLAAPLPPAAVHVTASFTLDRQKEP
jgi:hypothetical protein